MTTPSAETATPAAAPRDVQYHPLILRITHWLNALAMLIMVGSGWRIYNYYPALSGDFQFPAQYTLGGDYTTSEALHNELASDPSFTWSPIGPLDLRSIGPVQVFALRGRD